ncbi:hypothetical protein O4A46_01715 [Cupriavidus gilardii]|uniref:hypothetical protein n=1 Tax=Cupriavidus gilardii TaxID=82541 RepID=UPI00352DF523
MDKDAVGKVGDVVSTHLYAAVSAALKRIEAVLAKHGCPQGAEMADWLDAALAQQPAAQAAGLADEQFIATHGERLAALLGIKKWWDIADRDARIKAALLSRAAPSGEPVAYVECRECGRCGHTGINDAHSQDECCSNCDWTGPAPKEDVCPGCAQTGTMRAACPKCGSVYRLLCETTVGTAPQPSAQQAEQRDYRKELAEALGYPDGQRGGKPIGLAWELLIGYVKDMREYAERVERQAEQSAEEARGVDMDVLNALLDQINGRFSAAMDSAYAPGSDAFRRARRKFYESVETVRSTLALLAAPAAGTHDDMARGKTYGRVMMRAHALCPHGLSHPARMRWMAEYFMANYQGDAAGTGQEPIGYIDRKDVARLHTYKATIWPTTTEIDAVPVYTAPQVATGAGGAGVSHDYQRGYEDGQTDAQAATGAQGLDDVLAELDWCIGNGCYGPRTEKVLQRVRAILAQAAPSAASRDRADGFPILNAEHGDNAAKAERRKTAQTQYGCHHDESPM